MTNARRRILIVFAALLVSASAAALLLNQRTRTYSESAIRSPGKYAIDQAHTLLVEESADHWIRFVLMDNDRVMVKSDIPISSYKKWKVGVDSHLRVWLDSSDIGHYVWFPDAAGHYARYGVGPFGEKISMPQFME
jgi:hypothetical protein